MKPNEAPTVKAKRSPVILVVGLGSAFLRRCSEASSALHATVEGVEAGAESTFAMQTIPMVVVMQKDAVATSALGSIARELGIELVAVADDKVPDAELQALLEGALNAAQKRARRITR